VADELKILVDKINSAIRSERTMRIAVSTVLAVHKPRIFEQGLDADGAKIGTYSKNPISISKSKQARNTGQTYFPGGYAEYKSAVGKNPGFVILRNTDQMMSDYGIRQAGNEFGLGFQNTENYNKSIWVQDHFDKQVFDHTEKELDILTATLEAEIAKAI
jgi:hypothetical protein